MSFQITTAFVEQYKAGIQLLSQQKGSRFADKVMTDTQVGENAFVDQIGAVAAKVRTSRHADTPLTDTPHARRRITLQTYEVADLIDNADKIRTLNDPTNSYVQNHAMSLNRAKDDVIIEAFFGDAFSGQKGATTVSFDSNNQVPENSTGLTVVKLRLAKTLLLEGEVDEDEDMFIGTSAKGIDDLLGDTSVTSSDFNTVKALVEGTVKAFMGFEFVRSERLPIDSGDDILCPVWARSGVQLNMGQDITARISERDDKSYSVQAFASMDLGGTRLEEAKVVQIAINP